MEWFRQDRVRNVLIHTDALERSKNKIKRQKFLSSAVKHKLNQCSSNYVPEKKKKIFEQTQQQLPFEKEREKRTNLHT